MLLRSDLQSKFMAKRHTDWPNREHRGELNLAKQLCSFTDGRLHLWFDLSTLLGVNDIDVLLYHDLLGLFVIEVKALPIKEIEVFGWKKCRIPGSRGADWYANSSKIVFPARRESGALKPRNKIRHQFLRTGLRGAPRPGISWP